jgi:ornithine carbamoyltransferase
MHRHLLSLAELEPEELFHLVDRGIAMKSLAPGTLPLRGRMVGIYFRKTSTRTRTSFTVGAAKLGADVIAYGPNDLQLATGETIQDTARVLSRFLDALVMRTAESLDEMRAFADQPRMAVINAMADVEHPTQAIADLCTMKEHFGGLEGLDVLYLGEGNNTATALSLALSQVPRARLTLLTPPGYGVPPEVMQMARERAGRTGAVIEERHTTDEPPRGVDVVYTTRWQTTGTTKPDPDWMRTFAPFSVTAELMAEVSGPGTVFMHDLPAKRGEDVADEVLDGPRSIAWDQAEYKLYSAMSVLEWCMLGPQG